MKVWRRSKESTEKTYKGGHDYCSWDLIFNTWEAKKWRFLNTKCNREHKLTQIPFEIGIG